MVGKVHEAFERRLRRASHKGNLASPKRKKALNSVTWFKKRDTELCSFSADKPYLYLQVFVLIEEISALVGSDDEGAGACGYWHHHEDPGAEGGAGHPRQASQTLYAAIVVVYNTWTEQQWV